MVSPFCQLHYEEDLVVYRVPSFVGYTMSRLLVGLVA